MTLNERFVGGNPRVLLLLFCLFYVVLICFVGICPNMMRKSEFFLKPLTRNQTHHINYVFPSKKKTFIFQKVGTTHACGGTVVPTHLPKKNFVFFFSLIQKNTTSFILQTSISISIHHSKHKPQSKPTFIHPNTKFVHH